MRTTRSLCLGLSGALLALPLLLAGVDPPRARLNVLLVTLDTTRADHVGAGGRLRAQSLTPNIDRLARRGAVFTRAFSHNPLTLPAHANILTGHTALYHGVADNNGFRLDDRFFTLAEKLQGLGFATAAFVSSFVLGRELGLDQGFGHYREPLAQDTFLAAESVAAAQDWIGAQQGSWFCWLHLWDPHFPYSPPAPFAERFRSDPYAGEIAYVDAELGKLFSFLERSGGLASTLLVITGDHGEALGEHGEFEHGFFAYNSTLHVPLIICLPGEKPRTVAALVSHVDLFPTVCDALATVPPAGIAGRSLLPLLAGGAEAERPVYIESKGPYLSKGWAPLEGFIAGNLKYIDLPIKELYDLERDFGETRNIISSRRLSDLSGELAALKRRMAGTETAAARRPLSAEATRRLRSFGYLAGMVNVKKAAFTRADDLKTLLPIQNKLRKANQLFNGKKFRAARELYEQVLASKPDDVGSYLHLADTLHFLRLPQEAVAALRRGRDVVPGSLELQAKLGVFLTEVGRLGEAVELLQGVLAADAGNAEAWNYLGVALFRTKRLAQAEEAYGKALALDPRQASAHANLGSLLLARYLADRNANRLERARAAFTRAIELDGRSAAAYNGRGAAFKFAGGLEPALADWKKALELQPDLTDAYLNIGLTLIAAGRKEEAAGYLQRLRERFLPLLSARDRETLQRLLAEAGERD
ncbi:MAG: sulfatase-like hydrolase/transferase [Acidobacteria bacterium]|jgi:arylsulfatase A-like enzyme/thioredoxin-like negative regulator of GroEL|nr:sulfatase-like hydrolase/transferase [Acidobacteriota bacterium]